MVLSMEEYTSLRHEFLNVAKFHLTSTALEELKDCYAEAINSVRVLDRIEDIESLLRILEKRGVVRYNNIKPLKYIAKKYLIGLGINAQIDDYEARLKYYTPQVPPLTNLYQIGNGEFFLPNENLDRLSCPKNGDPRSKFNLNDDLSCCNNCTVPITPNGSELLILNNLRDSRDKNNRDILNIVPKDCNIQILSYHICKNDLEKLINKVDSRVSIPPSALIIQSEGDKLSATEDLNKTEAIPETGLLATPQSGEPQNPVRLSHVSNSSSKENLKLNRRNVKQFLQRKYVTICLIISSFAVILSLIIVYGSSKNSAHYNPQPSAPSPSGTEVPSSPYAGFTRPYNASAYPDYNATSQLQPPPGTSFGLQKLSPHEEKLQQLVFWRVSCELGNKWTEVARRLEVRESYIDQIQANFHLNIQEKAVKILYKFAEDTDLRQWRRTLMKALEKARRRDLKELVENLLSRE